MQALLRRGHEVHFLSLRAALPLASSAGRSPRRRITVQQTPYGQEHRVTLLGLSRRHQSHEVSRHYEEALREVFETLAPDWIVVDNDAAPLILRSALRVGKDRVVLGVQNPQWLPFGPLGVG